MSGKRSMLGGRVTWFFGEAGAHVRFPGFLYTRNNGLSGWSEGRSWRFLGLVCLRHNETRGGKLKHCKKPGWSVTFATFNIKAAFRKADNYVS